MKLLFSDEKDITDAWGKLHFGATPLRFMGRTEDPGFMTSCCVPCSDGTWDIYGYRFVFDRETSAVVAMNWTDSKWEIYRAKTSDGVHFDNTEKVFTSEIGNWDHYLSIVHNPVTGTFLALKRKKQHIYGYTSQDGRTWTLHPDAPFFDSGYVCAFWSPANRRYIATSKFAENYSVHLKTRYPLELDKRRIMALWWSEDGAVWNPPEGIHITPDEEDPPDLQFYRGVGFGYEDRCFLLMLNYMDSALLIDKHGPHIDTEWWLSRDGIQWTRPYRSINATPDGTKIITHNPTVIDGKLLFYFGNQYTGFKEDITAVYGVEQDRLTYVSARAHGEFSTTEFVMPDEDLWLNAAIPSPDRSHATWAVLENDCIQDEAYVMVAIVDETGKQISGFEPENCVFRGTDGTDLSLVWNGRTPREMAGRAIRLRFWIHSANVYAVTSTPVSSG